MNNLGIDDILSELEKPLDVLQKESGVTAEEAALLFSGKLVIASPGVKAIQDNSKNSIRNILKDKSHDELISFILDYLNASSDDVLKNIKSDIIKDGGANLGADLQKALIHTIKMGYAHLVEMIVRSNLADPIPKDIFDDLLKMLEVKSKTDDRFLTVKVLIYTHVLRPKSTLLHLWEALESSNDFRKHDYAKILGCTGDVDAKLFPDKNVTLIYEIAHCGNDELVHMLLDLGANPNVQDENGNTPLHNLAPLGDGDMIHIFLSSMRLNPNIPNNKGETAWDRCLLKTTKAHIEAHPNYRKNIDVTKNGISGLKTEAVWKMDSNPEQMVKNLADNIRKNNYNLEIRTPEGYTSLMLFTLKGDKQMVELLLEAGADPTNVDYKGMTSSEIAKEYNLFDIADTIIEFQNKQIMSGDKRLWNKYLLGDLFSKSHDAEMKNFYKWIKTSDNINAKNKNLNDMSVLNYACSKGFIDFIIPLLKSGADIESRDYNGFTPLMSAILGRKPAIVKILLDYGANLYAKDNQYKFPIDLADEGLKVYRPDFQAIRDMLEERMVKQEKMVSDFVNKGKNHNPGDILLANPYTRDTDGNTILHIATKNKNLFLVQSLIKIGIDLELKNFEDETAKDIAKNIKDVGILHDLDIAINAKK